MELQNGTAEAFEAEIIARGSYIDRQTGDGNTYIIEATTLRLNHVALNAWIMSEMCNSRDCYADGEAGDREWEEHKAEYEHRRAAWWEQMVEAIGVKLAPENESLSITQAQSEIFTAVCIYRAAK
jgi:hypothetical protein